MTLLLATHTYLWYLADSPRMVESVSAQMADVVQGIFASGFSELPRSAHDAGAVADLVLIHQTA